MYRMCLRKIHCTDASWLTWFYEWNALMIYGTFKIPQNDLLVESVANRLGRLLRRFAFKKQLRKAACKKKQANFQKGLEQQLYSRDVLLSPKSTNIDPHVAHGHSSIHGTLRLWRFPGSNDGNSPFGTPTSMRFLHSQRANDYIAQMEHDKGQGCHDEKAISWKRSSSRLKGPDQLWSHVHMNGTKIWEDSPSTPSWTRLKTNISSQKWLLEDFSEVHLRAIRSPSTGPAHGLPKLLMAKT